MPRGRRSVVFTLRELETDFAKFREAHPPGTWVPKELRQAAVAGLDAGVTAGELQQRCGVSRSQLERWRASRHAVEGEQEAPAARVLSVVDDGCRWRTGMPATTGKVQQ